MTIATQTARIVYVPNGVTTEFSFGFSVLSPATVRVAFGTTFITTGFTIELNADQVGSPGGKVIFTTPPVANDPRVVIFRWADFTQAMSYSAYDAFPAKSHERSLDTLEMQIQQMEDQIQRSYKVPFDRTSEEIPAPGDIAGADLTFPAPQKDMVLMWLNSTDPILVNGPSIGTFQGLVDQAESWATAAENSALAAQASSGQANSSAQLAQAWAESTIEVQPGKWSAKHWSGQASTYATNSANSATASANSATASAGSATLASKWADSSTAVEAGRYSAKYWADQAAAAMQEAITSLTSDDIDMIDPVIQGDIHARLLEVKKNRPNGIPKLTSAGKIEVTQLPISGMSVIGPFRGDDLCPKKGDVTCVPPDYRNPSQRFPNEVFHTGAIFLVTMAAGEASGHINLVDEADDIVKPIEVWPGDGIAYIDPADNVSGQPAVNVKGWYLIPGLAHGGVVLATNVFYDNTYAAWTGDNVQSVLDEISDYVGTGFVTLAGIQTITGTKTFNASPVLANNVFLYALSPVGVQEPLIGLAANTTIYVGSDLQALLLRSNTAAPTFYNGTTHIVALQDWVTSGFVALTGDQTINGTKTFMAGPVVANDVAFRGLRTDAQIRNFCTMGSDNAIYFGSPDTSMLIQARMAPNFYDGTNFDTFALQGWVSANAVMLTGGQNINGTKHWLGGMFFQIGAYDGSRGLLWEGGWQFANFDGPTKVVDIGAQSGRVRLQGNTAPVWFDGTTERPLVTTSAPHLIAGGNVYTGSTSVENGFGGLAVTLESSGVCLITWNAVPGVVGYSVLTTPCSSGSVGAYVIRADQTAAFGYNLTNRRLRSYAPGTGTHVLGDSSAAVLIFAHFA